VEAACGEMKESQHALGKRKTSGTGTGVGAEDAGGEDNLDGEQKFIWDFISERAVFSPPHVEGDGVAAKSGKGEGSRKAARADASARREIDAFRPTDPVEASLALARAGGSSGRKSTALPPIVSEPTSRVGSDVDSANNEPPDKVTPLLRIDEEDPGDSADDSEITEVTFSQFLIANPELQKTYDR